MSIDDAIATRGGTGSPEIKQHKFITIEKLGDWVPSHDFVYFRKLDKVEVRTRSGLVIPAEENMAICECIAVGPGRLLPNGALREAPCRPGQYFILNGMVRSNAVVTDILDDDGQSTNVVEGTYIIGARDTVPPMIQAAYDRKAAEEKALELKAPKLVKRGSN